MTQPTAGFITKRDFRIIAAVCVVLLVFVLFAGLAFRFYHHESQLWVSVKCNQPADCSLLVLYSPTIAFDFGTPTNLQYTMTWQGMGTVTWWGDECVNADVVATDARGAVSDPAATEICIAFAMPASVSLEV